MSVCRVSHLSSSIQRHCCVQLGPREPLAKGLRSLRLLCLIIAFVALTAAADLPALAQEEAARPLERVDVEAPQRRITSTRAPADRGADYDEPLPPDRPSSDSRDSSGRTGTGFGPNMPALSVITDKSAISMRAESLPSQVNVVSRQDIQRLDVRNYTDLFRKIPGVTSFTYGQGEIGNPIQIRGNSGVHGKDTGLFVDGVPQNFPSAPIAGAGMSDASWLTPEVIERIEVIKGPFSALYGNFAQAGVINIITKRSDPSPSIELSGASFGNVRPVAVISSDSWYPTPFLVNEYQSIDGYRDNSQYKRFSTFNKGSIQLWDGYLSLRFNYYRSDWGRPGYLSIKKVRYGIMDRRSALSTADGGDQRRWALVLNYSPADMGSGLYLTAFVEDYKINNFSTTPPSSQQLGHGDRIFYGGRAFYNFVFGDFASAAVGAESRYDTGVVQRFKCVNRQITSTDRDYTVGLLNRAWFVQAQVKPADSLKFVGGLRGDYFEHCVDNYKKPANSGKGYPSLISPKLGLVITPVNNVNIFANKGLGFRSPSAEEMSPPSGRKNFELKLAKTDSYDIGFNATLFGNFYLAVDYYQTEMEKEVRTVGDQAVAIGDSQRNGYEAEARFYASKQINLYANYAWVDARVKNPANPGQDKVTYVSEDVIKAGIEFTFDLAQDVKLLGDIYYQYMSGPPLYIGTDPKPVYGPDFDAYNFRLAWQGRNWGLFTAAKFQPRQYSSDTMVTVNDELGFNPLPIWDLSAGLKYTF